MKKPNNLILKIAKPVISQILKTFKDSIVPACFFFFFLCEKYHIVKVFNYMTISQLLSKRRPKSETFFPITYNIRNSNGQLNKEQFREYGFWDFTILINPFQPSFVFHIETSQLICTAWVNFSLYLTRLH